MLIRAFVDRVVQPTGEGIVPPTQGQQDFLERVIQEPSSEDEICRIVRDAEKVRAVGAGHSFNAAHVTDATLISLDRYKEVTLRPHPEREGWAIATVQAGVRLRDLNRILHAAGLALSVAGSTDPQAMGGLGSV